MRHFLITMLLAAGVPAQNQQTDPALSFEVASVKENRSGDARSEMADPPGRFTAVNVPLRELIEFAWQLRSFQLVGGPGWIDSARFDVVAKIGDVSGGSISPPAALRVMLRRLLTEHFALTSHRESREIPIFALTRSPKGKLGTGLRRAAVDCTAPGSGRGRPAVGPDGRPPCGWRNAAGHLSMGGYPLSQFAQLLSGLVQRMVVDRTGLSGNYDLDLTYAMDGATVRSEPAQGQPATVDPGQPSIFTALEEQLGLRLERTTGPVDVLVIDSARKPS